MSSLASIKKTFELEETQNKFRSMLGHKSASFIVSAINVVSKNDRLLMAEPLSIVLAVATAATLDLPLDPNLGLSYIVPYTTNYQDEKGKWCKKIEAQFQMGYKGFIQLCLRSGKFHTINVSEVMDGELVNLDRLTGEATFSWIQDQDQRNTMQPIGYVAYMALTDGFAKQLYMTNKELESHGHKYSKSYQYDKQKQKNSSLWSTDFDAMARKTVLKRLLSKYGVIVSSPELQKAVVYDQAIVRDMELDLVEYPDNEQPRQMEGSDNDQSTKPKVAKPTKKQINDFLD